MQDGLPPAADRQDNLLTRSESDISIARILRRRSLLEMIGIGAAAAAVVAAAGVPGAEAGKLKNKTPPPQRENRRVLIGWPPKWKPLPRR
jgi:hypothetical protein